MEQFLLRAKVEEWEHIEGNFGFRWSEGYLHLYGITDTGPKYSFTELEKGNCVSYTHYRNGEERYAYESVEHARFLKETISRWTGICDKNGKKIWEGDVVKTKYGRLCIVEWFDSPNYCGWDLTPVNTIENVIHTKAPDSYDIWKPKYLEVVGNKWDNPEFVKGE